MMLLPLATRPFTAPTDRVLVVDVMMAAAGRMSGQPLGDDARPYVEQMADKEDRVVVRCRPTRHSRSHPDTSTETTKKRR